MLRRLKLPIADPCHENWDAMDGEGARRHCEVCQTKVTNLSDMPEADARAFLRRKAGTNICVRYRSDREGNIRFRVPSIPAKAPTAMGGLRATLAAAGLAALMVTGCTGERSPDIVTDEGCTYEMGPFEFQLKRGEGNCPPEEDMLVMGAVPIEQPPEPMEMGKVAIEDPPEMGEAPIVEEEIELMGDVAAPEPEPEHDPLPKMGQAVAPTPDAGPDEAPCDAKKGEDAPPKPTRF